jgi:hypothetical protein
VPGRKHEVNCVRSIFHAAAYEGRSPRDCQRFEATKNSGSTRNCWPLSPCRTSPLDASTRVHVAGGSHKQAARSAMPIFVSTGKTRSPFRGLTVELT